MDVEVFYQLIQSVVKISQLALQVGRIVRTTSLCVHADDGHTRLLESIALLQGNYNRYLRLFWGRFETYLLSGNHGQTYCSFLIEINYKFNIILIS